MRLFGLPLLVLAFLAASCGPARPAYTDKVQDLPPEAASPRLDELTKLIQGKPFAEITSLVITWKRWLADNGSSTDPVAPLVEGSQFTFVYYDATDRLDAVFLDASFCAGQPQPLTRWENTRLFYRNFVIFKPSTLKYRFTASTTNPDENFLPDPFHPDVTSGTPVWSWFPDDTDARVHAIDASLEPDLAGQDLRILLPPGYDRDVSRAWPVLAITGLYGTDWDKVLSTAFANDNVLPLVVVSIVPDPGISFTGVSLLSRWTGDVLPWLTKHYRLAPGSTNAYLVGWGEGARAAQDAAQRPDVFAKVWTVPGSSSDNQAWDAAISQILTSSFAKVAP